MATKHELAEIERELGFEFPRGYHLLARSGALAPLCDSYLWFHEAEWIPVGELPAARGTLGDTVLSGLIPFAFNGGGDHWCWWTTQAGTRILFCPHDQRDADLYAPDFESWFFRNSLDCASSVEPGEEQEWRRNLQQWAGWLDRFGREDLAGVLREVTAAPAREYTWGPRGNRDHGHVTYDEVREIVRKTIGPEYLDNQQPWLSAD